jgi:hypothetical protein
MAEVRIAAAVGKADHSPQVLAGRAERRAVRPTTRGLRRSATGARVQGRVRRQRGSASLLQARARARRFNERLELIAADESATNSSTRCSRICRGVSLRGRPPGGSRSAADLDVSSMSCVTTTVLRASLEAGTAVPSARSGRSRRTTVHRISADGQARKADVGATARELGRVALPVRLRVEANEPSSSPTRPGSAASPAEQPRD